LLRGIRRDQRTFVSGKLTRLYSREISPIE
jgi:hypothetical protein